MDDPSAAPAHAAGSVPGPAATGAPDPISGPTAPRAVAGPEPAAAQPQPAGDLKPVTETPTEPTDYAAISLTFGALLAGLAAGSRSSEPIERADLIPLSAATFALSRLIVHDKAETWLRRPFVEEEGAGKRPRGTRLRYAVGELMSCTRCMGAWSALALVALRLRAPRAGRTVATVLATSAGNDVMQAGFSWLCSKANAEETSADRAAGVAGVPRRAA